MNIPTSRLPLEDEEVLDVTPDDLLFAFLIVAFCGALIGALLGALLVGLVWWLT